MKIVTFNIRWNNPKDGEFTFDFRKEAIVEKIQEEKPDVIGFQEIREDMQVWLEERLPEYCFIGHGRTSDFSGESIPVAFLKEHLKLKRFECFWLSDTPSVPGSKFAIQGYHPRICNMLEFYSITDKKSFRVWNTHLDNETSSARKKGMELIVKWSRKMDELFPMPVFIMGDMNAFPDWEEMEPIYSCPQYRDVTAHIPCTFHDFGKCEEKIDYIFIGGGITPVDCRIWEAKQSGKFLSDHYPICLTCEL